MKKTETITSLDDIARYRDEEPMPFIGIRAPRRFQVLDLFGDEPKTWEREPSPGTVWRELVLLVSALRREAPPASVLLSLIVEDRQTIGSIAASTNRDVEEVEASILALQTEGWVELRQEAGVERAYLLLTGPA